MGYELRFHQNLKRITAQAAQLSSCLEGYGIQLAYYMSKLANKQIRTKCGFQGRGKKKKKEERKINIAKNITVGHERDVGFLKTVN